MTTSSSDDHAPDDCNRRRGLRGLAWWFVFATTAAEAHSLRTAGDLFQWSMKSPARRPEMDPGLERSRSPRTPVRRQSEVAGRDRRVERRLPSDEPGITVESDLSSSTEISAKELNAIVRLLGDDLKKLLWDS
jgi:hypothetical protein